jgi:hypothetical protein
MSRSALLKTSAETVFYRTPSGLDDDAASHRRVGDNDRR